MLDRMYFNILRNIFRLGFARIQRVNPTVNDLARKRKAKPFLFFFSFPRFPTAPIHLLLIHLRQRNELFCGHAQRACRLPAVATQSSQSVPSTIPLPVGSLRFGGQRTDSLSLGCSQLAPVRVRACVVFSPVYMDFVSGPEWKKAGGRCSASPSDRLLARVTPLATLIVASFC